MGKVADCNCLIQITINKKLLKATDDVIKELNKNRGLGDRKYTRSSLISSALSFFYEVGSANHQDNDKSDKEDN